MKALKSLWREVMIVEEDPAGTVLVRVVFAIVLALFTVVAMHAFQGV